MRLNRATARHLPTLKAPVVNLLVALWLLAILNKPFWTALWEASGGFSVARAGFVLTLPIFALVWVWVSLELLTWGRVAKPVLSAILVLSAAVAYFMHRYGIAFDRSMLANVLETDPSEVRELLNPTMVLWIGGLGMIPAVLVALSPSESRSVWGTLTEKVVTLAGLSVVAAAILLFHSAAYVSLFRNHRELRHQIVPTNYLSAAHSYFKRKLEPQRELERVSTGAARVSGAEQSKRPMVFVLVVGETMRASNLALNGYERSTAPNLSARSSLVNFGRASSCGTATAVSLPCMFLDVGRDGYDDGMAFQRESLLDVLKAAGMDVWWLSNNSGCKGVCDRVQVVDVPSTVPPGTCDPSGCHDGILLGALRERLLNVARDTVVVLHMKGQHGPAYYLRYPTGFERFGPVCRDNALDRCDPQQVVNAYDNAVSYSDHVLDQAMTLLEKESPRMDAALVFVSDHGESLGERGMYLHGMPYDFAPAEQKEVPFMAWLPPATRERLALDAGCLKARKDSLSHDNLYHSMLGLTSTRASTYKDSLDVFSGCRTVSNNSGRLATSPSP